MDIGLRKIVVAHNGHWATKITVAHNGHWAMKIVVAHNGHWATKIVIAHMRLQRLRMKKNCHQGKGEVARATTFVTIFFVAQLAKATKNGYGLRFLL